MRREDNSAYDVTITETPETLASEILCTEILLYPSYPEDDKLKKHDRCSSKRLGRPKIRAANIHAQGLRIQEDAPRT